MHRETNLSAAELLVQAVRLHAEYRFREAASCLDLLVGAPDATPDQLLQGAKLLFQTGRFYESTRLTGRALQRDPASADTAAMHAATLERANRLDEARDVLAATLQRHPNDVRSIRLLAHIERRDGNMETAQNLLVRRLRHTASPDAWRLRYELAAVLDRLGDFSGAVRELTAAKQQLLPRTKRFRLQWRAVTDRQWQVANMLDARRLAAWSTPDPTTPSRPVCLMAGFPRSGTTLLERVLTSHENCVGTGESDILATQFRNPLVLSAPSATDAITELDGFAPDQLAAGRDEYFRCTEEWIGEEIGQRILIEKNPLLTQDFAVPLRLFPEAKIIMPLRDPRDVVVSYFFTMVPVAPESVAAADWEDTCRCYAESMRHWLLLRDRIDPTRWLESRYEDLIRDPETETRRIAEFLGVAWSPELVSHQRPPAARLVTTPTYDDVAKPLYTRSLGRWRNYAPWIEPHLHFLEPYLDAFGYR